MFRKDYIIRQAEEFGKFIAILFGLKANSQWPELEELINTSAIKYTNIEIQAAEKLEPDVFIETLINHYKLKEPNLKMLADLLYEKGHAYTKRFKEEQGINAYEKAFMIYEYILQNSLESDFSLDMHFKMASLKQLLNK